MKKIKYLVLFIAIMSITLMGCSKKGYIEITYNELQTKIQNKETFVLFIGRETCTACSIYKEILNERANEHKGINIYYIDLDHFTEEEANKIDTTYDYSGTPTSFIIENGNLPSSYDKFTGYNIYDSLIKKLREKGILKG